MMNNRQIKKGFTLVETLVAILILMTAVTGPLTLAYRGFSAATTAKEYIVGYFLAQDALEFVRFARDTNLLSRCDWIDGTSGASCSGGIDLSNCLSSNGCRFDSTSSDPPVVCPAPVPPVSGCPVLQYDEGTGKYQYTSGPNSLYRRQTNIEDGSNPDEITVTVTVQWTSDGGMFREATVSENMFNWP